MTTSAPVHKSLPMQQPVEGLRSTAALVREHEAIRRALAVLETIATRLAAGEDVEQESVEQLLRFLKGFADGLHHLKEEEVLFPALEAAGMPRATGPLAVMLFEHGEGRKLMALMHETAEHFPRAEERIRFVGAARRYAALMNDHIAKENGVLFRMAGSVLGTAEDARITEAFGAREREVLAPGELERLHQVLDGLVHRYLNSRR